MSSITRRIEAFRQARPAMAAIIGINAIVWLAIMLLMVTDALTATHLAPAAAAFLSMPAGFDRLILAPWTPLTYMFTQTSVLHLLFNMLWLYWFAEAWMTASTDRRLLWLYIAGGLCGAAAYSLYGLCGGAGMLRGSSAAVIAVTTASAIRTPGISFRLFLIGEIRLKWIAVAAVALSLTGFITGSAGAASAHLGGALGGLAYALAPRLRASGKTGGATRRTVPDALKKRRDDIERLDTLLDRIRISGFNSLSKKEQSELRELSARIDSSTTNTGKR